MSRLIEDAVKTSLVSRLQDFTTAKDGRTLQAAADYAVQVKADIDADTLQLFAAAKVNGTAIVQLLQPLLARVSLPALTAILNEMSEPYKLLGSPGHHPAKLPDDPAHRALADHLKGNGIVSSVTTERDGRTIRVNMKRQGGEPRAAGPA